MKCSVDNLLRQKGLTALTILSIAFILSPQLATGQVAPDTVYWVPNRVGTYIRNTGQFNMWHVDKAYGLRWPAEGDPRVVAWSRFMFVGRKADRIVTATADFRRPPGCHNCEFSPGRVFRGQAGLPGQPASSTHRTSKIYVINEGDEIDSLRNSAYLNWPIEDGAPRDAGGNPLIEGSSTVWCVYNDFAKDTSVFNSPVAGLEVQMTAWGHDRTDRLGDVLFFRFKIINKGGDDIHDVYTGIWMDPFISGESIQKLGCDTTAALAFGYRTEADRFSGERVPAIGAMLVQGPIVSSPGDTAHVSGRRIPGYRNLGLHAFWKYVNAGPPINQEPSSAQQLLNNMSGRDRYGNPVIDPTTGDETRYWYPGDPISGIGWLHEANENDRFLMSTGPFQLADGDTQEIAIAQIVTQGDSGLHSLLLLKQTAEPARLLYERFKETHFGPPEPPLPENFELSQNYPNPFNASTKIRYKLAREVPVTLKVFDILGREVATLVNERQSAGAYEVTWESQTAASGIYFYHIQFLSQFSLTRKMLVLK